MELLKVKLDIGLVSRMLKAMVILKMSYLNKDDTNNLNETIAKAKFTKTIE